MAFPFACSKRDERKEGEEANMVGAIALSSSQISQESLMFMFGWVLGVGSWDFNSCYRGGGNSKGLLDIVTSTTLFF